MEGGDSRKVDPDLTDLGQQQSLYLAQFLSAEGLDTHSRSFDVQNVTGFGITHLYCSLMLRAVQTGAAVARALDLPLSGWRDLHETGGIFLKDLETGECIGQPGRSRAFFAAHYPELAPPETVTEDGWWNRPFEEPEERPRRGRHPACHHRLWRMDLATREPALARPTPRRWYRLRRAAENHVRP